MKNGQLVAAIAAIEARLATLGSTADEVAATLAREGITGRRNDSQACPIAVYVKPVIPPGVGLTVSCLRPVVWLLTHSEIWDSFKTPPGVEDFVFVFDIHEAYPELAAS
jgi:hypothetical protein